MSPEKRSALGRGLGALIPGATGSTASRRDYFVVGIEEVHPSGQNPRQGFDDAQLADLTESIRRQGIIQPLVVRTRSLPEGGGFTLIAGERRWRAAQRAGLKQVPVVVREASTRDAFEMALVENLQRADLNPIEEADAFRRMCDEFAYTHEEVAGRVGRDRTTVVNSLRLLKLPAKVRTLVASRQLPPGHARALLGLDDAAAIERAAERVIARGLTARQTELLVRLERQAKQGKKPEPAPADPPRSASVRDLETRLARTLGTKVHLVEKNAQAGKVEIEYRSLDDLDRLLERLLRPLG